MRNSDRPTPLKKYNISYRTRTNNGNRNKKEFSSIISWPLKEIIIKKINSLM